MAIVVWLRCSQCQKNFKYIKNGNVLKKFCTPCTKSRNALAKIRFRKEDKDRKDTHEEELMALELLSRIPDREISMNRVFDILGRQAT